MRAVMTMTMMTQVQAYNIMVVIIVRALIFRSRVVHVTIIEVIVSSCFCWSELFASSDPSVCYRHSHKAMYRTAIR